MAARESRESREGSTPLLSSTEYETDESTTLPHTTTPLRSDDQPQPPPATKADASTAQTVLWKLYVSHALSTWNARSFEFGAVIFLSAIFPRTLFYASCYALFRALAATVFSSAVGRQVDARERLSVVRHSIIWARVAVAASCALLLLLLRDDLQSWTRIALFASCVVLACVEKLAFVGNTVAVERDWAVVVAEGVGVPREDLNSAMRRIDLVCKLVAPLGISLVEGWSTRMGIWVVLAQNAASVIFEYFAIAQVYTAVPALANKKEVETEPPHDVEGHQIPSRMPRQSTIAIALDSWRLYFLNPAFLASFSLALLYFTVLGFGSQMTTYLLTLHFTALHISLMRLASVLLELTATCAAPLLMRRIGAIRAGLWFLNAQLLCTGLALGLFTLFTPQTQLAALALVAGVALSRLGLWGFDLSVQFLVQEHAPEATRGSFSAVEAALQNAFELCSFASTMVWARPEQFKFPVWISGGVVAAAASCFAAFVRKRRGHLLHTSRCWEKRGRRYKVLPTIEEETEMELEAVGGAR